jgi:8-oxo-dGTP pyrophosphatase MutT (NUDIX family)
LEKYKKVSSDELISNSFMKLKKNTLKKPDNDKDMPFYVMEFADWVNVVPLTEDMNIVMIKQYRAGIDEVCIEIPGGIIDEDEDPILAAKRELIEETGYSCERIRLLKKVSGNPAIQNNFVFLYLAEGVKAYTEQNLDEDEKIEVFEKPMKEVKSMLEEGQIHHPYASLSLMLTLNIFGYNVEIKI